MRLMLSVFVVALVAYVASCALRDVTLMTITGTWLILWTIYMVCFYLVRGLHRVLTR